MDLFRDITLDVSECIEDSPFIIYDNVFFIRRGRVISKVGGVGYDEFIPLQLGSRRTIRRVGNGNSSKYFFVIVRRGSHLHERISHPPRQLFRKRDLAVRTVVSPTDARIRIQVIPRNVTSLSPFLRIIITLVSEIDITKELFLTFSTMENNRAIDFILLDSNYKDDNKTIECSVRVPPLENGRKSLIIAIITSQTLFKTRMENAFDFQNIEPVDNTLQPMELSFSVTPTRSLLPPVGNEAEQLVLNRHVSQPQGVRSRIRIIPSNEIISSDEDEDDDDDEEIANSEGKRRRRRRRKKKMIERKEFKFLDQLDDDSIHRLLTVPENINRSLEIGEDEDEDEEESEESDEDKLKRRRRLMERNKKKKELEVLLVQPPPLRQQQQHNNIHEDEVDRMTQEEIDMELQEYGEYLRRNDDITTPRTYASDEDQLMPPMGLSPPTPPPPSEVSPQMQRNEQQQQHHQQQQKQLEESGEEEWLDDPIVRPIPEPRSLEQSQQPTNDIISGVDYEAFLDQENDNMDLEDFLDSRGANNRQTPSPGVWGDDLFD